MQLESLVASMTPEVYQNLRTAVETGKWPDGKALSQAQRESSMQAVLLYQAKVAESDQHMTVGADGQIVHKSRQQLKQQFTDTQVTASQGQSIARFTQDDL